MDKTDKKLYAMIGMFMGAILTGAAGFGILVDPYTIGSQLVDGFIGWGLLAFCLVQIIYCAVLDSEIY